MEYWAHQKEAIQRAAGVEDFALLFEPGTGKTGTMIGILRQKFAQNNGLFKVLILCPTVVCENWKNEWAKFSRVPPDQVEVLLGHNKERVWQIENTKAKILITNYQSLTMEPVFKALKMWRPKGIVADESHKLKTPGAKTTKKAIELSQQAEYKWILTGTPVLQSLMDFFSQFKFLDNGQTFGNNFAVFKSTYFYNKNANAPSHITWPDWRIRPNAEKEVRAKVFQKAMFVEKSECLDLPPLVRQTIEVELSAEQRRVYKSMEKEFIAFVGNQAVTANIVLTKGLRLMQIVSGFVKTEDGKEIRFKENPRAEALKELLSNIAPHHKVIVWACFKENYETIKETCGELGLGFVELHGGTTDRAHSIDMFQTDEDIRVLIGNQGAGGIGVNLTAASYAIYFSRNFSLEHDIQSEARNYRGGSERHVKITRIDLVTKETIDADILEALSKKQNISDIVLKGIVSERQQKGKTNI